MIDEEIQAELKELREEWLTLDRPIEHDYVTLLYSSRLDDANLHEHIERVP